MFRTLRSALCSTLTLALLMTAVAGCGAAPASTPDAMQAAAVSTAEVAEIEAAHPLIATAWNVDYFGPPDEPVPMLPDSRASVTYFWDRYAGFDGCNFLLGVYAADSQGQLTMYAPAITTNVCEPQAIFDQAVLFQSSLLNVTSYALEGEKLTASTVEDQRLLTLSPAPVILMPGTRWEFKLWWSADEDLWSPVLADSKTTMIFGPNGQASGNGGCNDYTVSYEGDLQIEKVMEATATDADLPALTFGPISAQAATCSEPADIMAQEAAFFAGLGQVAQYFKLGGMVLLLDDEGTPFMVLGATD